MNEIDRRALLGVTVVGAGLALAGCQNQDAAMMNNSSGPPLGDCENWGELVSKKGPGPGEGNSNFVPTAICCVYISLVDNKIKVRHAYWAKRADMGLMDQVRKMMITTGTGTYQQDIRSPIRIHDNFEKFSFASRTKIYIFIDNNPDEFGFVNRDKQHIIRFTEFSSNDRIDMSVMKIQKNFAFYNLSEVDFSHASWPYTSHTKGYSLDFWNTDERGDIGVIPYNDPERYHLYSMNIHLQMAKSVLAAPQPSPTPTPTPTPITHGLPVQTYLPIILDPDTGNMGGVP